MRAYLPISHSDLSGFLASQSFNADQVFAPTPAFINENLDCDEEEIEYTLSLVAAEDALELVTETSGSACVLAFEVPDELIESTHDMSITLRAPLTWKFLECCFEVSEDGEELTWYSTQEIANNISRWIA